MWDMLKINRCDRDRALRESQLLQPAVVTSCRWSNTGLLSITCTLRSALTSAAYCRALALCKQDLTGNSCRTRPRPPLRVKAAPRNSNLNRAAGLEFAVKASPASCRGWQTCLSQRCLSPRCLSLLIHLFIASPLPLSRYIVCRTSVLEFAF